MYPLDPPSIINYDWDIPAPLILVGIPLAAITLAVVALADWLGWIRKKDADDQAPS